MYASSPLHIGMPKVALFFILTFNCVLGLRYAHALLAIDFDSYEVQMTRYGMT